jgi:cell division protein FtsB
VKKRRKSIILRFATGAFIVYLVYIGITLFNLQMQIGKKQMDVTTLTAQVNAQKTQNENAQRLLAMKSNDQLMQSVAKDKLNYATPGEKVFINATGN